MLNRLVAAAFACLAALAGPALAAGDADAGRVLYQARCAACHSLDYNGAGPAHCGVLGRAAGQVIFRIRVRQADDHGRSRGPGSAASCQTRITWPFKDQKMANTSLRVGASMLLLSSAAIASSVAAMNSCSLMFMPRCVLTMSWPL